MAKVSFRDLLTNARTVRAQLRASQRYECKCASIRDAIVLARDNLLQLAHEQGS